MYVTDFKFPRHRATGLNAFIQKIGNRRRRFTIKLHYNIIKGHDSTPGWPFRSLKGFMRMIGLLLGSIKTLPESIAIGRKAIEYFLLALGISCTVPILTSTHDICSWMTTSESSHLDKPRVANHVLNEGLSAWDGLQTLRSQ